MEEDPQISDDYLVQAARRRLLKMLENEGGSQRIVNNVYGAGGGSGGGGFGGGESGAGGGAGMFEQMQDPFDYFVDIERRDVRGPDIVDEETGQPRPGRLLGWDKKVHRFRSPSTPRGTYGKKKDLTYIPVDQGEPDLP